MWWLSRSRGHRGYEATLLRQARKRFGAEVAERSAPLLARIEDPERLEDPGGALLDSADGEGWLRALRGMAERQEVFRSETRSC